MHGPPSILPLSIDRVVFEAGGRRLIDDVSLELPRGGPTVVLGPNGAGKSILLRLCHGLLVPTGGSVRWSGQGGTARGSRRHAMVFQKPVMLRRSARANVAHALAATGMTGKERDEWTDQVLERFGLSGLADRPARLLSGGEQQRLAIARAWALRPEMLFLDEPTSQLDPGATRQIEQMLEAFVAEGMTLVMATHDLGQARRLGDRVLFLDRGKLVEDGPAATFFAGPSSMTARAFLAGDLPW